MAHLYRSITAQSLHYFARPQAGIPHAALTGPQVWRGDDFTQQREWIRRWKPEELAEIEHALAHAEASGKPRADLVAEDFPLPTLAARFADWQQELQFGKGFVVLRGLPIRRWSASQVETVFWCLGWHLGLPGAQNRDGELLGHVRDTGADIRDWTVREYRSNVPISFHCDAADVVGLLCLQTAKSGGLSRIASSVTIFNTMLEREPALARRLFRPMGLDARGESGLQYMPVTPACYADGCLRTFWHSGYFRSVSRYPDAPRIDAEQRAAMDLFDSIADEPGVALEMELEPGDIQWVSNHSVVHSRSGYVDHEDPERRRHLLRLWLSFANAPGLAERWQRQRSLMRLLTKLGWARWQQRGRFARAMQNNAQP